MKKAYTKMFRVFEIHYRASDHSHAIMVCSADGELWRVTLDRLPNCESLWRTGLLIEVPMVLVQEGDEDRSMIPDFATYFGDHSARRMFCTSPFQIISQNWGVEAAINHFPPETRGERVFSDPTPPPTPKRRKSKAKEAPPSDKAGQD